MNYKIDYSYFIFPFVSFILSLIGFKSKSIKLIVLLFLILYLGFSLSGADFDSYTQIYNSLKSNNLNQVHGEVLYKKLNQFAIKINLEYVEFKIIYYSILYIILYFCLLKMSNNIYFSFFIGYTGYLLYFLTINRQFLSMVFCILGFYLYSKKKNKICIFFNFIAMFIHISSVVPLLYFLFIEKLKNIKLTRYKLILILIVTFLFRISIGRYFYKLGFIFEIINKRKHFEYYASSISLELISLGLLNRVVFLVLLIFLFNRIEKNKFLKVTSILYFLGSFTYIMIPSFIIERLMMNTKFLEILIIPNLIFENEKKFNIKNKILNIIIYFMIVLIGLILLFTQLKNQIGYYPYRNYFN